MDKAKGTVLVVDDEQTLLELATDLLTSFGYDIITARNGEQALDIYGSRHETIDVILMDMCMPGIDGAECLDRILQMDPGAKVIMSTGYSSDGWGRKMVERGAAGFLDKPFHIADVIRKIEELLQTR